MRTLFCLTATLVSTSFMALTQAQEVSIPDPGLNAAIRETLSKPNGPLTKPDLLRLTALDASRRNVRSIGGLEAALNLVSLDLQINRLTNFSLPTQLTNLASLVLGNNGLRNLTLPSGLGGLTNLDLEGNELARFNPPSDLTNLVNLNLGFNSFTNFSLPSGFTRLSTFYFAGNPLTNVTLPPGLSGMTDLNLSQNLLTSLTLPPGMTNLIELDLFFNQLTNLALPSDLRSLTELNLDFNQFASLTLPTNLDRLNFLHLRANQFTHFTLPAELTALFYLDVSKNPLTSITLPGSLSQLATLRLSENLLTSFTLPIGLTNLTALNLSLNQLTNVVLPPDLLHLETLNLGGNQLISFTVPAGLANLTGLFLTGNQLTNITLPPDMRQLVSLGFLGNPLATLVLSEPLAAASLAEELVFVRSQGVSVVTYPLSVRIVQPRTLAGTFQFDVTGPPGIYTVLGSTNLADWSEAGGATNTLGSFSFVDGASQLFPRRYYRARRQDPPANMVFIAPNTFIMGSPTNELHRDPNEGPTTTVTLTRGFWIGKYEVTEGEYLSVTGTNPSAFPGDLSRPVSNVSWPDATNYCRMLTQRELAAGRISAGSEYRLPTEAEWECAARAGTTTRFSYGDDPDYVDLENYAWQSLADGLTVHPVGRKLPNPWGLYDMSGNVFEWCQDWLGPLPGGLVTDPQGPPSNPIGWKIMRGGAFDFGGPACRSASRMFFGNHPALTDWNLGFRVVLSAKPH